MTSAQATSAGSTTQRDEISTGPSSPVPVGADAKDLGSRSVKSWLRSAAGLASAMVLGVALALSIGQDANGDQLYSHTLASWAALHPHQDLGLLGTLIPALWDVPWFLIAEHAPAWVSVCYLGALGSISWFLSGRIAWSLLRDVKHRWRLILSLIAAGFAVVAPATLTEFATTFGDLPTSILVLSAILLIVNANFEHSAAIRRASAAGLLMGLAVGLKLTNVPFLVAAAVALVLADPLMWRRRLTALGAFGAGSIVGAALSGGYFWIRNWERFGNPIYPFYNRIFGSPYFDDINGRDTRFVAKTPFDHLTLPWRMVTESGYPSELPGRDLRWALLASLGVAVACLAAWRRASRHGESAAGPARPDVRFFGWFMLLSWAIWSLQFGAPRYFISIEMLSGCALIMLLRALMSSPLRVTVASLCMLAATASVMIVPAYPGTPIAKGTWYSFRGDALTRQPDTMIVMQTHYMLNYTIAAFPDDATFVELWAFQHPTSPQGALRRREVSAAVRHHTGPILSVVLSKDRARSARAASRLGFTQSTDCGRLQSSYYPPLLCPWVPDSAH
jgi:hypothetical protein